MNKPEPMTDDKLREMFGDGLNGKVFCEIAKMAIAARDKQWEQMLAGQEPDDIAAAMGAVADEFAHKLALDLECILAEYSGKWYDTAIDTLGKYRAAMREIHETISPTFMGEPLIVAPQPAQEPIPYSGADENPPVFARRCRIADDGFGLQRDDDGPYVHIDDALSVLHQSAQPAQEPVEWPQTPEQISDFVGANFVWREGNDATPSENDKYCLTAHDLISAFRNWNDFSQPTPNHTALLEQALEALVYHRDNDMQGLYEICEFMRKRNAAIAAIREALK